MDETDVQDPLTAEDHETQASPVPPLPISTEHQFSCADADDATLSEIISVSYAKFDTALGNTIHFTIPESLDVSNLVDLRSIQDVCFPDGAHDSMTDIVHTTLRRRRDAQPEATDGRKQQGEDPVFAFAAYHQKKDAAADRGASQRSILILSSTPIGHALRDVAKNVIFPFFDSVPISQGECHEQFVQLLYDSLLEVFRPKTGRAVAGKGKRIQPATQSTLSTGEDFFDRKGTLLAHVDRRRCDVKMFTIQMELCASDPDTDPHLRATRNRPARNDPSPNPPLGKESSNANSPLLFSLRLALPLTLPSNKATMLQQLCFAVSLKALLKWFSGRGIAMIHWCLLSRVPVLFVGSNAEDVSHAVRATILLLQPIDVNAARFAPYCTLEMVDYFIANMSSCAYLVLGATNAYVCHKEFAGAAKCDLRNGKVELVDSSCLKQMPKSHRQAFDDLCTAAKDPAVAECYLRARCIRFNLAILRQMSAQKGRYYESLCRIPNLVEAPLKGNGEDQWLANDMDSDSGFLVVDTKRVLVEDAAAPHLAPVEDAEGGSPSSPLSPRALVLDDTLDFHESTDPDAEKRRALLRSLHCAIDLFEDTTKRNHSMIVDVDSWYKDMCKHLRSVASDSEPWHREMVEELSTFSVFGEEALDPSLLYCPSDPVEALTAQQEFDRTQRLRIVQDYKERVFLMIDSLSKNNNRALMRKVNRSVVDLFSSMEGTEAYHLPSQVLFHTTTCKTVWYVHNAKVTISGTAYLTRNYILFEASAFAIRRRHQIIPLDCVKSVAKDTASVFSSCVKVMVEIPPTVVTEDVLENATAAAPATVGLIVFSNFGNVDGFYQLLHSLVHRQKRLMRLLGGIPPQYEVPQWEPIERMFISRVVPVGLFTMSEQWFIDEVWENERNYPIVGWSSRLLLSDPPTHSDFSGLRQIDMTRVKVPKGFETVYDWRLAKDLRIADETMRGVLSDELMLRYGKIETPYSQQQSSGAELKNTRGRSGGAPRGDDSPSIEYLYNTNFTAIDSFRMLPFLGCSVRRRLWVRVRKLQSKQSVDAASTGDDDAQLALQRTLSTSSSDMVESPRGLTSVGVPLVEENDDG